jgi:ATP-dependent RNA circularization protein (DNA/RNA ligase family)
MRSDAVEEVLQRQGADEETVQHLVEEGRIRKVHYDGWTYYIRIMEETQDVEVSS